MTLASTDLVGLPAQIAPPAFVLEEHDAGRLPAGAFVALAVLPAEDGTDGPVLGPGASALADSLDVDLLEVLAFHGASGAAGELTQHVLPGGGAVLLVGLGASRPRDFRDAGAALARASKGRERLHAGLASLADDAALRALVEGLVLGSFEFHWRSAGATAQPVGTVVLDTAPSRQPLVDTAAAIALAGWRSRALATTPSNLKNPAWLAEQATVWAAEAGLDLRVWDEAQLRAGGFGGILAVGQASATPPRLIQLDYVPPKARRRTPHLVLVGKGITFDSGGLSIKPADSMVTMKRDMTGGAVVLATMAALAAVGCPLRVTGLVAAAENAVSGSSYRPGDVIRHYGGRTTEVTNTDAEGRLVLADALAYAVSELKPDAVVDIATLTGAAKVALGLKTGALFANDDALAARIADAGDAAGERLWRLPLAAAYEERLSSKIADADNAAGGPGAITAALFLQHFVGGIPWAHLDVAPVGDTVADDGIWTTGPSGFGARLLLHWLEQEAPLEGIS
ncbi:leucyl aminopeptidase family protein [Nocardioides jiangxiensis]|uniref:Probable cytosol aminopeptidase n=1 Tax=Nocardioides jiangxiensis TaxID=3064524 RepID=A0ABT9B5Q4_9ACTN|nr:leucyl aminopeptidase family protein [Nocardioides sp. WY-20]MDO7868937.1 leucyl aminopeptidase family protein [Nocardioides sp. WY-20]